LFHSFQPKQTRVNFNAINNFIALT
jgi:hypothetical protein